MSVMRKLSISEVLVKAKPERAGIVNGNKVRTLQLFLRICLTDVNLSDNNMQPTLKTRMLWKISCYLGFCTVPGA